MNIISSIAVSKILFLVRIAFSFLNIFIPFLTVFHYKYIIMTIVTDYGHYYNKLFKGENQHVYSKS